MLENIKPIFISYFGFYAAHWIFPVFPERQEFLNSLMIIVIFLQLIFSARSLIDYLIKQIVSGFGEENSATMHNAFRIIANVLLWTTGILLILSNLGVEITSLVASLGIGGIAIAFALQNVLSDIFASFTLFFDKPFQVGDYILVGSDSGVVQKIGMKSTRIQTLQGEEMIISNQELTNARVQNFKRMEKRRIVFSLGLTYDTTAEKLKKAKEIVKDIINTDTQTELGRVHFKSFGDFSLNFEIVYYVLTRDYNVYMDIQERINLEIKQQFEKEGGLEMAFPTQTIHTSIIPDPDRESRK
ncbi:MAG: mechanosensitive ion channel family protein [Patescibacteria group bacterium]|nr:mechanosensitive ion channel family protein [Patescibacteria group bacterium]